MAVAGPPNMDEPEFVGKYRQLLAARGGPSVRGRDWVGPTSAPRSDSDMRARRRERSRKEAEKEEANRRAAKVRAEQMRLKEEQKTQEERKIPAGGGKSDAASRRARVPAESSKAVWTLLAEVLAQDPKLASRGAASVAYRCKALHREFVASLSLEDVDDLCRDSFLHPPGQ